MVLQGTLRVENEDGLFEEVPAGKIVLLPKGLYTVSDILPKGGIFEAVMCFYEQDVIQQFLDSLLFQGGNTKGVSHAVFQSSDDIRYFTSSILRLYGGNVVANRQLTKMKLFELLHLIYHSIADKTVFPTLLATLNNKERRSLQEFMEANFHKPLGIEDYAYLTGRSVSTFSRDFKAKFDGISPKQWLIERRLEKARGILAQNHISSISEVALESGYENIPHFIKEFHKRFGITPKQFVIQTRIQSGV